MTGTKKLLNITDGNYKQVVMDISKMYPIFAYEAYRNKIANLFMNKHYITPYVLEISECIFDGNQTYWIKGMEDTFVFKLDVYGRGGSFECDESVKINLGKDFEDFCFDLLDLNISLIQTKYIDYVSIERKWNINKILAS